MVVDKTLLKRIRECPDREPEVVEALKKVEQLGPARLRNDLTDWNVEQGLLLYRGKVYVPNDQDLRAEIVRIHHDSPMAGHPGLWKTVELVSRNYYWYGMVAFIKEYVRTCDTCHRGKTSRSKPLGPLQPNEIPDAPMRVLTTDFIVGLPKVTIEGIEYDAIQVMADKHSKMVHLAATDETVDAERAAWHLIRDQV